MGILVHPLVSSIIHVSISLVSRIYKGKSNKDLWQFLLLHCQQCRSNFPAKWDACSCCHHGSVPIESTQVASV